MHIDLLNNEIMANTDLSTAKHLRCNLPNKECSQHVWNMFPMLNKDFWKMYLMRKGSKVNGF